MHSSYKQGANIINERKNVKIGERDYDFVTNSDKLFSRKEKE